MLDLRPIFFETNHSWRPAGCSAGAQYGACSGRHDRLRRYRLDVGFHRFRHHDDGTGAGALATGIFAIEALPNQLLIQAEGVVATIVWAGIGSFLLLKLTDLIVGLRVDEDCEHTGLDLSEHSERGYVLGSTGD